MALTIKSALRKDKRTAQDRKADGLQHRHFAFIAATLADMKPRGPDRAEWRRWHEHVETWADACARENPRFDRERFRRACDWVAP